jgi:hypothetical protein
MEVETLTGVPDDKVGEVVQSFIDDGAEHTVAEKENDGTFTVSASFAPHD